jgi:hypothetical protein
MTDIANVTKIEPVVLARTDRKTLSWKPNCQNVWLNDAHGPMLLEDVSGEPHLGALHKLGRYATVVSLSRCQEVTAWDLENFHYGWLTIEGEVQLRRVCRSAWRWQLPAGSKVVAICCCRLNRVAVALADGTLGTFDQKRWTKLPSAGVTGRVTGIKEADEDTLHVTTPDGTSVVRF